MSDFPFERTTQVHSPGTVLMVQVYGVIRHYGIATGYGTVIHTSRRFGYVKETDMADFSQGRPVSAVRHTLAIDGSTLVARARSRKGDRYNVLVNNCEHFVTWVISGKGRSRQLGPVDARQFTKD